MTTVKYKGHKRSMPVLFPIGIKSKSGIEEIRHASPFVEMNEEDAQKLVELDAHNFEIHSTEGEPLPGDCEKMVQLAREAKPIASRRGKRAGN